MPVGQIPMDNYIIIIPLPPRRDCHTTMNQKKHAMNHVLLSGKECILFFNKLEYAGIFSTLNG